MLTESVAAQTPVCTQCSMEDILMAKHWQGFWQMWVPMFTDYILQRGLLLSNVNLCRNHIGFINATSSTSFSHFKTTLETYRQKSGRPCLLCSVFQKCRVVVFGRKWIMCWIWKTTKRKLTLAWQERICFVKNGGGHPHASAIVLLFFVLTKLLWKNQLMLSK
jgi:hypothetical protein